MGTTSINQLFCNLPAEAFTEQVVTFASVEFGTMTREGRCVNIGICRMASEEFCSQTLRQTERKCRRALAHISTDTDGRLSFYFPKLGMLPCTERALFMPGYFLVPTDFILPAELFLRLPEHARQVIAAGKYRVHTAENGYTIRF